MDVQRPFRVERSTVLKDLILIPSSGWPVWVVMGIGLAVIMVGCFFDIRFMVLGLMICVSVVPALVAFIYFSHTLSPDMVANLLPHTLERCTDGYLLRIWRRNDEDDSDDDVNWMESGRIRLYDADVVATRSSFEYERLFFKNSLMKILYVPKF